MCHACTLSHLSHVRLFVTPWTVAGQAPLAVEILQARILEWVSMPSSRRYSQSKDQTHTSYISCIDWQVPYHWHHLGSPQDVDFL